VNRLKRNNNKSKGSSTNGEGEQALTPHSHTGDSILIIKISKKSLKELQEQFKNIF
jgi:hypothetical protein